MEINVKVEQERLKDIISRLQGVSQFFNENFKDFKDGLIIFNGQIKNISNLTNDFEQMSLVNAIKHLSKILREQQALSRILAYGGEHFAKDIFYIWQDQIIVLKGILGDWKAVEKIRKEEDNVKKNND